MEATPGLRVVLVHDWLTGMRGGEKCLEVACRYWADAPLFTLLHRPGSVASSIEQRAIVTSWFQRLPRVHSYYRYLLPLMPRAASAWRLPACDLVVSFSHCVAKAAVPSTGVPHVCYCFTPMRYAWHMREAYIGGEHGRSLKARLQAGILARLSDWDRSTADRVTHFVAISRTVQQRIAECYGRESTVIYPPVDTEFYRPIGMERDDYYLVLSAFAPYKRIDLAIAACERLRRRLVIVGTGQEERRLRAMAGPNTHFLGWQSDASIREQLCRCRALLFPGEEDFGIVPLEAQACGTPVIALGRGGATETVVPPGSSHEPTGVWFMDQTVESLVASIEEFERSEHHFEPAAARRQAERFNAARYERELIGYLESIADTRAQRTRRAA